MKHAIRILLVLSALIWHPGIGLGQNRIWNAGFEFPDYGDKPADYGELEESSLWHSDIVEFDGENYDGSNCDDCIKIHSPDWWSNRLRTESPYQKQFPYKEQFPDVTSTNLEAHSGHAFVGMAAGELFGHWLHDRTLNEGQTYYLSFYVRLFQKDGHNTGNGPFAKNSSYNQTRIRVYMASMDMSYTECSVNSSCYNDQTTYLNKSDPLGQDIVTIADVPIPLSQYPLYEWHQVNIEFVAPDDSHDWIAFELQDWGEDLCKSYIGIDDVSLLSCNPMSCDPTSGEMWPSVSGSHDYNTPWRIDNIDNVEFFLLQLGLANQQSMSETYSLNCVDGFPNGWHWTGKGESGQELASGPYKYLLTVGNQCGIVTREGNFVKNNASTNPTNVVPLVYGCDGITYVPPKPCCPYEPIIYVDGQNWVEQDLTIHATEKIIVASIAPVVVGTNSNVVMRAGERIELNPGFSTDGMESFIAEIVPCPNYRLSEETLENAETEEFEIVSKDGVESEIIPVTLYPNPTTGLLTLTHSQQLLTVEVYDPLGRQLLQTTPNATTTSIDLSGQPAGIYIIRTGLEDGGTETHRVVLSPP